MWDLGLEGKNILVTGGGSGIGRAVAIESSRVGANVVVVGRSKNRLDETLSRCAEGLHLAVSWDLAETETLNSLVSLLVRQAGSFDGVVHAAGLYISEPLRVTTKDSIQKTFAINFLAPYLLTKALAMKPNYNPGASVVFVSSVSAAKGQGGAIAYSSSKAAINSLSRSLVAEIGRRDLRFNSVVAGLVETDLSLSIRHVIGDQAWQQLIDAHPLGIGSPQDIANAAIFLLSGKSKWMTGAELVVDGGYLA
jgi:NAD(P)-dependent dehydrogenase (short-subunit alcohol dehydrogenase family)